MSPGFVGWPVTVVDDVLGDLAGVEGIRALVGDGAQGLGEGRVLENGPDRLRLAVGLVEIGAGDRIVLKEFLLRQEAVEARARS